MMHDIEDLQIGHRDRLRDRFEKTGLTGFAEHEVLELLLTYCIPRKDTKAIAKLLLHRHKTLYRLMNAPTCDIVIDAEQSKDKIITARTALFLKLVRDVGIYQQKQRLLSGMQIAGSKDVSDYLCEYFKGVMHEEFHIVLLNNKNVIIDTFKLFEGTPTEAHVYIRTIIEKIIQYHATALIIAHNHPTGNLTPSSSDISLTERIKNALSFIDVRLLDHLIIGDNDSYSFAEHGSL